MNKLLGDRFNMFRRYYIDGKWMTSEQWYEPVDIKKPVPPKIDYNELRDWVMQFGKKVSDNLLISNKFSNFLQKRIESV